MPVVRMQKVALITHSSYQEELLEFLHDKGVMEVSPNEDTVDIEHPRIAYEEAEVRFALDFLRPFASKSTLQSLRKPSTPNDIQHSALNTDFREIIDECKKLEDASAQVVSEEQQLLVQKTQLLPWANLPVSLDTHSTENTVLITGTCSGAKALELQKALTNDLPRSEFLTIAEKSGITYLAVFVWKEDRDQFDMIAANHGFSEISLPQAAHTPAAKLQRIEQSLRVLEGKKKEITQRKTELSTSLPNLARLLQYLFWLDEKQSVRSEIASTDQTVTLAGWIPKRELKTLEHALEETFPAVALLPIEPKEGEEPPIQIHNVNSLAPFEAVTRLYGLPQGNEMDPTRPLMPFFILYFGLCLTDAGYGLTIALLLGLAIWMFKIKRQEQKLLWLLFYSGIVTFFVSIPFGGWFGILPTDAPEWLTYIDTQGRTLFLGQLWDLQKDVDFFRNLALTLGAIQIMFGIFLAGYWKWIHGKKWEAFCSHFTAHLFVIALALRFGLQIPGMEYALMGIGALFVWGQGSGAWFIRPLIGALGTVNFLIGLMSNILSYLRILALGLATGALAFAINQIAAVISDLLPAFIGIPAFILILIFGHLISIGLNGLGSFVHSGRLQFIEFFGQFFQGGGREFAPFKKSTQSIS